jgi:hypothetical protein
MEAQSQHPGIGQSPKPMKSISEKFFNSNTSHISTIAARKYRACPQRHRQRVAPTSIPLCFPASLPQEIQSSHPVMGIPPKSMKTILEHFSNRHTFRVSTFASSLKTSVNSRGAIHGSRTAGRILRQRQIRFGVEGRVGKLAGGEPGIARGGDHGGVVGRERA